MSVAAENFWNAQNNVLKRIRNDLSSSQTHLLSPSENRKDQLVAKYLPKKRQQKYVPPVSPSDLERFANGRSNRNVKAFHGNRGHSKDFSTYDESQDESWGEETDEDDFAEAAMPHPFTYPLPMYVPQTGFMYPSAPLAIYYPAQGGMNYGKTPHFQLAPRQRPSLKKMNRMKKPNRASHNRLLQSEDQTKTVTFQSPLFQAYSPGVRGDFTPKRSAELIYDLGPIDYFLSQSKVADVFVNDFINDYLASHLLPEILLDVFNTWPSSDLDLLRSSLLQELESQKILSSRLNKEQGDIVREAVQEITTGAKDPLELFLDHLINGAVATATKVIVKETVQEMAREYVEIGAMYSCLMSLVDDIIIDDKEALVNESVWEYIVDEAIDDLVLSPEVTEMSIHVAADVLQFYDSKLMKGELILVDEFCSETVIDSLILDHLLSIVARQGDLWTDSDLDDKALDAFIVDLLLVQTVHTRSQRSLTLENYALRSLNRKVVTNIALDVLLERLAANLDEDLADVDEYERGLNQAANKQKYSVSTLKSRTIPYSAPSTWLSSLYV